MQVRSLPPGNLWQPSGSSGGMAAANPPPAAATGGTP
jgi:hypothetical protein